MNRNNPNMQSIAGQMMPPRQEVVNNAFMMKDAFPRWLAQYGVAIYVLAMTVVSFTYSEYSLPWYYMLSGGVAVLVFFLYGSSVIKDTSINKIHKESRLEKRIFFIAFVPRMLWMLLIYTIFMQTYDNAFGFENADASLYNDMGQFTAKMIASGNFRFYDEISKNFGFRDISDMGYPVYLGFIYWLTDNSIIVVRFLKCIFSSLTVLYIYRVAKRNFGDQTARIAAILCALWPNFWYYSGCHLKETEMVFLTVLYVEQTDQMLRSRQFTVWKLVPLLLIVAALFTLRTPLALVALLSLLFSVVISSSRVVSWGKRIIVGLLAVLLIGVTMGNRIQEQTNVLLNSVQSGVQQKNMEWRTRRTHGNSFAKYAGKSVFAPLIFSIPFPSMVRPFDGQEQQQLLNGGNFIKNIISFFTILAMFSLLISGEWRRYLVPLSFMLGYLAVITMSVFAQSERFHQPAMPFEIMFATYGLSIAVKKKKYKRWFTYWCALMFVACIAWNWFKLAGRGLE